MHTVTPCTAYTQKYLFLRYSLTSQIPLHEDQTLFSIHIHQHHLFPTVLTQKLFITVYPFFLFILVHVCLLLYFICLKRTPFFTHLYISLDDQSRLVMWTLSLYCIVCDLVVHLATSQNFFTFCSFFFFFFSFCVPSCISGVHHFWWDFCICDWFFLSSNYRGSHIPSSWMVHAVLCCWHSTVKDMKVRVFWVCVMESISAQTRPQFILSPERVSWGMVSEPMITPMEISPLLEGSNKSQTHNAESPRTASQTNYWLSYSSPPLFILMQIFDTNLHTELQHHATINSPETRYFSDSITLVTGLRCTVKVWKSCGPWPTVSGCWTMTRTVPELVP